VLIGRRRDVRGNRFEARDVVCCLAVAAREIVDPGLIELEENVLLFVVCPGP
jgi:hypothetical protein